MSSIADSYSNEFEGRRLSWKMCHEGTDRCSFGNQSSLRTSATLSLWVAFLMTETVTSAVPQPPKLQVP